MFANTNIGIQDIHMATRLYACLVTASLAALGLKASPGAHVLDRYGYLAGRDVDRAADINAMFADPEGHTIAILQPQM